MKIEPRIVMLCVTVGRISAEQMDSLRAQFVRECNGSPLEGIPIVIVPEGTRVEAVSIDAVEKP